jgi:hypothetical protein
MATVRSKRLQIMLALAEVKALDDWRFAERMPNRSSALRELLRRGLIADGFDVAPRANRRSTLGVK